MVAIQQKIWIPLGMAIIMLARGEEALAQLRHAGGEHVVHPEAEAEEAGARSARAPSPGSRTPAAG